jgi:hypothetical protein
MLMSDTREFSFSEAWDEDYCDITKLSLEDQIKFGELYGILSSMTSGPRKLTHNTLKIYTHEKTAIDYLNKKLNSKDLKFDREPNREGRYYLYVRDPTFAYNFKHDLPKKISPDVIDAILKGVITHSALRTIDAIPKSKDGHVKVVWKTRNQKVADRIKAYLDVMKVEYSPLDFPVGTGGFRDEYDEDSEYSYICEKAEIVEIKEKNKSPSVKIRTKDDIEDEIILLGTDGLEIGNEIWYSIPTIGPRQYTAWLLEPPDLYNWIIEDKLFDPARKHLEELPNFNTERGAWLVLYEQANLRRLKHWKYLKKTDSLDLTRYDALKEEFYRIKTELRKARNILADSKSKKTRLEFFEEKDRNLAELEFRKQKEIELHKARERIRRMLYSKKSRKRTKKGGSNSYGDEQWKEQRARQKAGEL